MFRLEEANGEATYFEEAMECAQYIIDNAEAWDEYDDMIRDCYGDVEIMGMTYDSATALERLDPIAYRCGYTDWMDSNYSDIEWDLDHMCDGDEVEYFGYRITH